MSGLVSRCSTLHNYPWDSWNCLLDLQKSQFFELGRPTVSYKYLQCVDWKNLIDTMADLVDEVDDRSWRRYLPCYLPCVASPARKPKKHQGGLGLGGWVYEEAHLCFPYLGVIDAKCNKVIKVWRRMLMETVWHGSSLTLSLSTVLSLLWRSCENERWLFYGLTSDKP